MQIGCIIQARLTSKRFPKKIFKKIKGTTILEIVIDRVKKIKKINKVIVAIPSNSKNKELEKFLKLKKIDYFKGSEKNVLERYYLASKKYNLDTILRVTSDCPLIDPYLCGEMLDYFKKNNYDYVSNILRRTFPVGLDCEIFSKKTLYKAFGNAKSNFDKEHVTPYMRDPKRFKIKNISNNKKLEKQRWTLDYKEDYKLIRKAFIKFDAFNRPKWYRLYKLFKKDAKNKNYINRQYIV